MINNNKPLKQVNFRVTPEEYAVIQTNARSANRTLYAYLKELALNKVIINYNYRAISEHTKELNRIKTDLNYLIIALSKTDYIYPADIQRLIDMVEDLTHTERNMLRYTQRERKELRNYVKDFLSTNNNQD